MTEKDGYNNPCRVVNVLLADDDVFCNATLASIIETSGQYRVFPFYNGAAVCKFFETRCAEVGLIILDLEMPGKNGVETAGWIRHFEATGGAHRVPILGLTGYEGEEVRRECRKAGMNRVMSKPIKRIELIQVLKEFTE